MILYLYDLVTFGITLKVEINNGMSYQIYLMHHQSVGLIQSKSFSFLPLLQVQLSQDNSDSSYNSHKIIFLEE